MPPRIARHGERVLLRLPANPATAPGAALPSAPVFAAEPIYTAMPGVPAPQPPLTPNLNPGSPPMPFPTAGARAAVGPAVRGRCRTRFGDPAITDIRRRCAVTPVGALATGRDSPATHRRAGRCASRLRCAAFRAIGLRGAALGVSTSRVASFRTSTHGALT